MEDLTIGELAAASCIYIGPYFGMFVGLPLLATWLRNLWWGQRLAAISVATWRAGVWYAIPGYFGYRIACWICRVFLYPIRRLLLWAVVCGGVVPICVAWLEKLAYHAGRWLATGDPNWAHVFVPVPTDRMVRTSFMLGVDHYVAGYEAYRTTGFAITMHHWRMGALTTAQLACISFFLYGLIRVALRVRNGVRETALRRRRAK